LAHQYENHKNDGMSYCAQIEYDGTAYYGFQRQRPEHPTIQSELEKALGELAGRSVTITGAGRTDSGVHATGQVIGFTINWRHSIGELQRALNANLPQDIVVLKLEKAALAFHPRFDARRRAYRYYLYNVPLRSPLRRLQSWQVRQPLDLGLMNQAASLLVGKHDFATFGMPPQGIETVRDVYAAHFEKRDEFVVFNIEANAFLYRMVRSIVGSLVAVGTGSWTIADFRDAFAACDRNRSGAAAPPQGLYLVSVVYEDQLTEIMG
jgi:tRNA pseudouridine38-40 synthase